MKIRTIIAALCMAAMFGACSDKETDNQIQTGDSKSVYLRLSTAGTGKTKAEEPTASGTTAPLLSAIIYFLDGNANPVAQAVYTAGATGDITIDDLEAGYEFENIPSTVTQVYVVGNYNSSNINGATASFPTTINTSYSQISEVVLNIEQVAYPRLADGTTTDQLLTVMDGLAMVHMYGSLPDNWNGDETLEEEDMYADVTIAPLNARLEIEQISYSGTLLQSFTLEGIYINNHFELMPLNLTPGGNPSYAPTNNGSDPTRYQVGNANFAYTNYSTLYDIINRPVPVTGGAAVIAPTTAGNVWAYHLFGNSNPPPHIILKLTDVVYANGTTFTTRYVTVKGFRETGVDIGSFERNVIYKLTDLPFTDANISPVPEPEDINIWVHVQVEPWETIEVTPII